MVSHPRENLHVGAAAIASTLATTAVPRAGRREGDELMVMMESAYRNDQGNDIFQTYLDNSCIAVLSNPQMVRVGV